MWRETCDASDTERAPYHEPIESRVTLKIEPDYDAESPGDWNEHYTLYMGRAGERHMGTLAAPRVGCEECGEDATNHPVEADESYGLKACETFTPPGDIIPAMLDSRGPYTTLETIDTNNPDDVARWSEGIASGRDRYVEYGYFKMSNDEGNQEWLMELPPTSADDGKEWSESIEVSRRHVLDSVIDNWNMYLRGDVYTLIVERETLTDCGHTEREEEFLSGVYGSTYAESFDAWADMGVTREEYDSAERLGYCGRW